MYEVVKNELSSKAQTKANFFKKNKLRYVLASAYAGLYVGLGIFLIMVVGAAGKAAESSFTKVYMGLAFGIALSLVMMIGAELFTGNNLIMMVGVLDKKVSWKDSIGIWIASYVGNFIGSIAVAGALVVAGVTTGKIGTFILYMAKSKMSGTFMELLMKGILCNILVCLAVMSVIKMKSESGKLIMIFWCLFAFITSGFEHSVANMSIFVMSLMIPHSEVISISGMFGNLIPVTIGNFIGGAIVLGVGYFYLGNTKK